MMTTIIIIISIILLLITFRFYIRPKRIRKNFLITFENIRYLKLSINDDAEIENKLQTNIKIYNKDKDVGDIYIWNVILINSLPRNKNLIITSRKKSFNEICRLDFLECENKETIYNHIKGDVSYYLCKKGLRKVFGYIPKTIYLYEKQ